MGEAPDISGSDDLRAGGNHSTRFLFAEGRGDFGLVDVVSSGASAAQMWGGKVVKNAAGFDLPKFFVGSLGRFGVLAEMTFKVFPRPASTLTLRLTLDDIDTAARVLTDAANTRWEPDALDLLPDGRSVLLRLAAPEPAIAALSREILARWPGKALAIDEAAAVWADIREFRWAHPDGALIKVPTTAAQLPALRRRICGAGDDVRIHVSAGGDVAFISSPHAAVLDETLRILGLCGMTLRGAHPLWCGVRPETQIAHAVKYALDPQGRFPALGAFE